MSWERGRPAHFRHSLSSPRKRGASGNPETFAIEVDSRLRGNDGLKEGHRGNDGLKEGHRGNDGLKKAIRACSLSSPAVNLSRRLLWPESPVFFVVNVCTGEIFCNWQVYTDFFDKWL